MSDRHEASPSILDTSSLTMRRPSNTYVGDARKLGIQGRMPSQVVVQAFTGQQHFDLIARHTNPEDVTYWRFKLTDEDRGTWPVVGDLVIYDR